MGATIATLLDSGWDPEEWNSWTDTLGQSWSLADCEDIQVNMRTCDFMLRALRRDLQQQVWQESSLHALLQERAPWAEGLRNSG